MNRRTYSVVLFSVFLLLPLLLASTAASFSGWTFVSHPGAIYLSGLAYAFASFYVLTIPITGAFFGKRTWLMGKRYGFVTPGDMYAYYYNNEAVRFLVVATAFLYATFYSALQLTATGALFHYVTGLPAAFPMLSQQAGSIQKFRHPRNPACLMRS